MAKASTISAAAEGGCVGVEDDTKLTFSPTLIHPLAEHVSQVYLLVSEDEKDSFAEFVLCQHPHKLFPGFTDTLAIVGINYEDEPL